MHGGMLVTLVNTSSDLVTLNDITMHGRFLRDDDKKIVTDYLSRIQWTDGNAGYNPYLLAYSNCGDLEYDGGGWSLPTLSSLNGIRDLSKANAPYVYDAFKNINAVGYWADNWDFDLGTSTVVNFQNGANVEIPIGNFMNYVCTRFIPANSALGAKSNNSDEIDRYNSSVIRD